VGPGSNAAATNGFIAHDWHGPATTSLASLSWKLHTELAASHDGAGRWGYRAMDSMGYAVTASESSASSTSNIAATATSSRTRDEANGSDGRETSEWLDPRGDVSPLGTIDSTTQVIPGAYVDAVFQLAKDHGLRYVRGRPLRLHTSNEKPSSLDIQTLDALGGNIAEETLLCEELVICAGAWTAKVLSTLQLPSIPVTSLPGNSVILRAPSYPPSMAATAIFATIHGAHRLECEHGSVPESPELFPRGDGTILVDGDNTAPPLPDDPAIRASFVSEAAERRLLRAIGYVSGPLSRAEVIDRQLCYRSTMEDGRPALGKLKEGVWVATGHGPWGVTLSLGTGRVLAELILGGVAHSADVSSLAPSRFT
jgi:glycine/D-amino acid oxidase-like deaminating enzyme